MKVRTNLTATELRKIGKGLQTLADKHQSDEIELENVAEQKLMKDVERVFEVAMFNLNKEMDRIMAEKDV